MSAPTCSACGHPLTWLVLEPTGKALACDPEVRSAWLIAIEDADPAGVRPEDGAPLLTLVTEEGLMGTGIVAPNELTAYAAQWTGRTPHWSTCQHRHLCLAKHPDRDEFCVLEHGHAGGDHASQTAWWLR